MYLYLCASASTSISISLWLYLNLCSGRFARHEHCQLALSRCHTIGSQEHDRSRAYLEVSRPREPPEWSAPLYQGARKPDSCSIALGKSGVGKSEVQLVDIGRFLGIANLNPRSRWSATAQSHAVDAQLEHFNFDI